MQFANRVRGGEERQWVHDEAANWGLLKLCVFFNIFINAAGVTSSAVRTSNIALTHHLSHAQHPVSIRLPVPGIINYTQAKVKVKQSLYRPGHALRVAGS